MEEGFEFFSKVRPVGGLGVERLSGGHGGEGVVDWSFWDGLLSAGETFAIGDRGAGEFGVVTRLDFVAGGELADELGERGRQRIVRWWRGGFRCSRCGRWP